MAKPKSIVALAWDLLDKSERRMKRIGKLVQPKPEPAPPAAPAKKTRKAKR